MRMQVFGLALMVLALVLSLCHFKRGEQYEARRSEEDYAHPVCTGT